MLPVPLPDLSFMYLHHDSYWTPHRAGGFPVALACMPLCGCFLWINFRDCRRTIQARLEKRAQERGEGTIHFLSRALSHAINTELVRTETHLIEIFAQL